MGAIGIVGRVRWSSGRRSSGTSDITSPRGYDTPLSATMLRTVRAWAVVTPKPIIGSSRDRAFPMALGESVRVASSTLMGAQSSMVSPGIR